MRFPWRDRVASLFVGAAVVAYAAWQVMSDTPSETSIRVMTGCVLALGFAASATAVVPAFDQLLHGSRAYLGVASVLGLVALATGVVALFAADETMLAVLVTTTVVMWAMATLRHVRSLRTLPAVRTERPVETVRR